MCIDIDVHFHCPNCHHTVDRLTYRRTKSLYDPGPEYKKHICHNNSDVEHQAALCPRYIGKIICKGCCRERCDSCISPHEQWKRVEKRRAGWIPEERLESQLHDRGWNDDHLDRWIGQSGVFTDPILIRPGPPPWRRLHPPRYASWAPGYIPPANPHGVRRDVDAGHAYGQEVRIVFAQGEQESATDMAPVGNTPSVERTSVSTGRLGDGYAPSSSSQEHLLRRSHSS